ncbi:MAG TPA: L-2-hydroxyglutarate oxidase [Jatrophihabitans sp.]|nr:L-2-hydroxyglutarate oxidase [Jatrophihabitans sp.]
MTRYVIVGGGILGLATARALLRADPAGMLTLLEKEPELAQHQTGHNSGVIHSGIYYPPGSAKARMCRAGAASMTAYAEQHGIPVERTGKLIVATEESELPRLTALHERALANCIEAERLGPEQAREHEPFVAALAALRVSSTAITDYSAVCRVLAGELSDAGADLRLGTAVHRLVRRSGAGTTVQTDAGDLEADVVVNCAGLQADLVAATDRLDSTEDARPDSRIVPFRGEYYELRPQARYLVKGLIYPVPDPQFPFLGVHLTKMIGGSVHAGPNAVLALAREGYRWRTVRPAELMAVLGYPGFWRLARRNLRPGLMEVARSLSKKRFAQSLARLVPEITEDDLVPSHAGVRAQALRSDGALVDDFLILQRGRNVHVLNAPSPAATSSLEIGNHIAGLALAQ